MRNTSWQREWNRVQRLEYEFLRKGRFKKVSAMNRFLENKVPEGLQDTLDKAFAKAFEIIFEKGTGFIEKTYDREGIETQFMNNVRSADLQEDRDSLRLFSRSAAISGNKNLVYSGIEGIGLGALGIGLPDIPLFTGMLLKSIYESALHFGYSYDTDEEKYFILKLMQTALSHGKDMDAFNDQLNQFISDGLLPPSYSQQEQIRASASTMSSELLYMKFLQGLPIVGAIGGAYDIIYMQKIQKFAQIKYHRRFLTDKANGTLRPVSQNIFDPDDGPDLA